MEKPVLFVLQIRRKITLYGYLENITIIAQIRVHYDVTVLLKIWIINIYDGRSKKKWLLLPNSTARAECDTRSIFKQILTGLNSEFYFS